MWFASRGTLRPELKVFMAAGHLVRPILCMSHVLLSPLDIVAAYRVLGPIRYNCLCVRNEERGRGEQERDSGMRDLSFKLS